MNIVSLNDKDIAGLSYNLCTAINELTNHHAVNVALRRGWTRYPAMVLGKKAVVAETPQLLKEADVVHINEHTTILPHMGVTSEDCKGKRVVFHSHGSPFRRNHKKIIREVQTSFPGAVHIVSTVNLLQFAPNTAWFPSVIPINHHRENYPIRRNNPPVLYGSHTRPRRHRPMLIKATDELREEGLEFETNWVGGVTNKGNLTRMCQADVCLNGMKPFYGVGALEASAFEMPVITGMNEFSTQYMEDHGVECPYILANNISELKTEIRRLVEDADLRVGEGKRAYEYAKKHHSAKAGVKRFLELVE